MAGSEIDAAYFEDIGQAGEYGGRGSEADDGDEVGRDSSASRPGQRDRRVRCAEEKGNGYGTGKGVFAGGDGFEVFPAEVV